VTLKKIIRILQSGMAQEKLRIEERLYIKDNGKKTIQMDMEKLIYFRTIGYIKEGFAMANCKDRAKFITYIKEKKLKYIQGIFLKIFALIGLKKSSILAHNLKLCKVVNKGYLN